MLKRLLMLSVGAAGLTLALTACGGSDPEPADTTPIVGDDDDDDTTTDTYTTDGYLQPSTLFLGGWFAFEEDSGQTRSATYDGNAIDSVFYIRLGTASFTGDPNDQANYCTVWVDITGATNETWATDDGYLFGFTAGGNGASITDDCLDKGFDPEWFGGAPADLGVTYPFGLAIGGDPSDEVTDWMAQVGVDPAEEDNYIGGRIDDANWGLPEAEFSIYWNAYEIDGDFNIDFDTNVDRYSISDGGGSLADGFYEFGTVYYWNFS